MSGPRRRPPSVSIKLISVCFLASALASVALAVVYVLGGQVQAEGALLGVALGGISIGLILWAKDLMPGGTFVEEREPHTFERAEVAGMEEALDEGLEAITRRRALVRFLGVAAAALGVVAFFPIRSLGQRPGRSLLQTNWSEGKRLVTLDNVPIRPSDVEIGGVLTVYPEGFPGSADSSALLLHIDSPAFIPEPGREDWAPEGLVGYSKLCTHAGCPVGLYEVASQELFCPCHQSVFDVLRAAAPVGGPATRPLPQLPLGIDEEGYIYARGDFSDPVGPGFWKVEG